MPYSKNKRRRTRQDVLQSENFKTGAGRKHFVNNNDDDGPMKKTIEATTPSKRIKLRSHVVVTPEVGAPQENISSSEENVVVARRLVLGKTVKSEGTALDDGTNATGASGTDRKVGKGEKHNHRARRKIKEIDDIRTDNISSVVVTDIDGKIGSFDDDVPNKVLSEDTAIVLQTDSDDGNTVIRNGILTAAGRPPRVRRRLAFGREVSFTEYQPNVKHVYKIVKKLTGSIGGNGSFGAIYGELTVGSMQKMIDLMKEHTSLDKSSRFIDVGSGLGKPNLHVAQDPGVAFSYGIEMEHSRWLLSIVNLKRTLEEAKQQPVNTPSDERIGHRCMFAHNDIKHATTFDPFTHVYMFSIGFPPKLWMKLADMFNSSASPYLICYHSPRTIVDKYGFDVELITQMATSMHASGEGHMGYIYKRAGRAPRRADRSLCDPLFRDAYDAVQTGFDSVYESVKMSSEVLVTNKRTTRSKRMNLCIEAGSSGSEGESEDESDKEN